MFLGKDTSQQAHKILKYSFVGDELNINTVRLYFIFSGIALQYYSKIVDSTLLKEIR